MDASRQKANELCYLPAIFAGDPYLIAAQSTRCGGVSPHPYASLNLGLFTDDEAENVEENRSRFFSALEVEPNAVAHSYQVHEDQILVVEEAGAYRGYDALITGRPNIFCCVTVADCTPILVYDPKNEAVAAIHAGWRGTAMQIVRQTLEKMRETFGALGADCRAYIGTCIAECSYEVGADVADHFAPGHKRFDPKRNKFYVDLKAANKTQLLASGLLEKNIEVSPHCTFLQNDRYFSHRKEMGTTGRMLAGIGMRG
jgi:YfiH family protein